MLRIAICDSDRRQQSRMQDYISRDMDIEDAYHVECFDSIVQMRKRMEHDDFCFDVLFLMVEESGEESLAFVRCIRERMYDVDVFFMADNLRYISDAFRCKAFSYLLKPFDYKKFCYEMRQYLLEKKDYQKEYLAVSIRGREQMIPLNAVHYFTSDVRKIGAFFLNGNREIWFYGKLDVLEGRLESFGFLRCHQSYLVNGHKIKGVTRDTLITHGGSFPITRKYAENVKKGWERIQKKLHDFANIASMDEVMLKESAGKYDETIGGNSTVAVTRKDGFGASKYGMLVGIRGERQHSSYRLYHGEEAVIGRDRRQAQIVVSNPAVSRRHCGVRFDVEQQCYFVRDYSTNGTLVSGMGELEKDRWVCAGRDSVIRLVNEDCSFMLV